MNGAVHSLCKAVPSPDVIGKSFALNSWVVQNPLMIILSTAHFDRKLGLKQPVWEPNINPGKMLSRKAALSTTFR